METSRLAPAVVAIQILFGLSLGLELLELRVPAHVPLGTRALLACRWALAPHDSLYSVKWYKDGKEFFRHVPRDLEPRRKFPLPGVDVEKSDLSGSTLTLSPAVVETAGRYRCEVSGERPLFPTVSDHAHMMVVALPSEGPTITGLQSHYRVGELLSISCTSGRARPAAALAWYVNGEPASPLTLVPMESIRHDDGLESSSLGLSFVISEEHFRDDVIKVKCLATLGSVYWRSNEESAHRSSPRTYDPVNVKRQALDLHIQADYRSPAAAVIPMRFIMFLVAPLVINF
ncbi:uncharacterized protein LOC105389001 [Plutella xylostella]|uniref:uncharacterized protein LOC105389001 n=1 Tax=Plutella xylostella TaxID=51655 RepID=UPI0020324A60|nr:uncharacterized protein LOC105389001 [Plutella xylostella]